MPQKGDSDLTSKVSPSCLFLQKEEGGTLFKDFMWTKWWFPLATFTPSELSGKCDAQGAADQYSRFLTFCSEALMFKFCVGNLT